MPAERQSDTWEHSSFRTFVFDHRSFKCGRATNGDDVGGGAPPANTRRISGPGVGTEIAQRITNRLTSELRLRSGRVSIRDLHRRRIGIT